MKKTVVLNVVGLSHRLIGEHTPFIRSFMNSGSIASIKPVLPAVTCTAQSTYLTGKWPSDHGIVGNGWYFKDECEVKFWKQSNGLVQSEKLWEKLKSLDSQFTCANLFWWYNMYSSVDYSATPRPNYLADGRKIPDIYSHPAELRDMLQLELGRFPLFNFWGPKASIKSSKWIAEAAMCTDRHFNPTLSLVYLPHLDYSLQRNGINFDIIAADLLEVDTLVEQLAAYYATTGTQLVILSEYGITSVTRPVHINRYLRKGGYLSIRHERGLELLDAGASKAFALADHQIAHIYVNDKTVLPQLQMLLEAIPGVGQVLSGPDLKKQGIDHERCGDLVLIADRESWFTYYYWEDDRKAPDFARAVDIHKKPGYDPVEMFLDPLDKLIYPRLAWKLLKKKLGFRTVMDVIPLRAELVKGSHGRIPEETADYPVFITSNSEIDLPEKIDAVAVYHLLERHVTGNNS